MGVMFKVKLELQKEGKTLLAKLSLPASLKIAFWECFAKCSTFKHESTVLRWIKRCCVDDLRQNRQIEPVKKIQI